MNWKQLTVGTLTIFLAFLVGACAEPGYQPPPAPDAEATSVQPVERQLVLGPAMGTSGTQVAVTGSGWKPGEMVLVVLEDESGRSSVLTASIPDSTGTFRASFFYPTAARWSSLGAHTLLAYTASETVTETQQTADFQVMTPEDLAQALQPTVTPTLALTHSISLPVALNTAAITNTSPVTASGTVTESSAISSTEPTAIPAATETPQSPASVRVRPLLFGRFYAAQGVAPLLDGDFGEWSNTWYPIRTIVFGAEAHGGEADLSGEFQARWSEAGLFLAVRVRDDAYRPGPNGTDMWQGDGLEIHFDRLLALDFEETTMNGDDYQIGITPAEDNATIRSYRWIPQPREAVLSVPGAVRRNQTGYDIEAQIPWSYFDVIPGELRPGDVLGFNISINDNDGDTSAQQTIASASPARTDHETPTEWGTLILAE